MEKVGHNIRKFRELKNYTQTYMAESLNVSQSQYQRIESGEAKVAGELVDQVSEILGVTPELLYSFDERSIFQSGPNSAVSCGSGDINYYSIDGKLEKLYEDKIKLLEAEVSRLKQMVKTN